MSKHVYIIAEAGVNHNGSLDTAKQLILEAKKILKSKTLMVLNILYLLILIQKLIHIEKET